MKSTPKIILICIFLLVTIFLTYKLLNIVSNNISINNLNKKQMEDMQKAKLSKVYLTSTVENMDSELLESLQSNIKEGSKVAYISSSKQDEERIYFKETSNAFKKIHPNLEMDYFDLSSDFTDADLNRISNYSVIFLSGGNTYDFLYDSNKRNLKNILDKARINQSTLIGASAGSIIMTPNINLAGVWGDENNVKFTEGDANNTNLTSFKGFNFVSFEFYPHFYGYGEIDKLNAYKKQNLNSIVYTSADSSGILVEGENVTTFGKAELFK